MKLIKHVEETNGLYAFDIVEFDGVKYDRVYKKDGYYWYLQDRDKLIENHKLEQIFQRENKLKRICEK